MTRNHQERWLRGPRLGVKTYALEMIGAGFIKIGRSVAPEYRRRAMQAHSPFVIKLIGTIDVDREYEMHKRFSRSRVRGEWFKATPAIRRFFRTGGAS